jgi:hypothetical protein
MSFLAKPQLTFLNQLLKLQPAIYTPWLFLQPALYTPWLFLQLISLTQLASQEPLT